MKRRAAISLVELLVVMSACTLILSTVSVLLYRTMRAQSEASYFFDAERSALRLSRQFRDDVHRAKSVSSAVDGADRAEPFALQLELADGAQVEYRQTTEGVVRFLTQEGRQRAREDYRFAEEATIAVRRLDSPQRLELLIIAMPEDGQSRSESAAQRLRHAPLELRVETLVGADLQRTVAAASEETQR